VLGKAGLLGIKAITKEDVVFICEGLKDWLTARALGLNAVSSTNGCNTFKFEWVNNFKGKTIYIIYDRDKPGVDNSRKVACYLYGTVKKIYIINLPYKVKPKRQSEKCSVDKKRCF